MLLVKTIKEALERFSPLLSRYDIILIIIMYAVKRKCGKLNRKFNFGKRRIGYFKS